MIKVVIPHEQRRRLEHALTDAGSTEIGGILMGEHVSENTFHVVDLTVQRQGRSASFWRLLESALRALDHFFNRTSHNYKRFNYLGEWHSHPSFELCPSTQDELSIHDILDDPTVGARFVVLMIVKKEQGELRSNAWTYISGHRKLPTSLEFM